MYGLLVLSVIVASAAGILLRRVPLGRREDLLSFNFIASSVWVVLLFALLLFSGTLGDGFTSAEIGFGVLYGGVQAGFLVAKSAAFSRGPVSVTTLVGNCSVLLSTFVSVVVFRDPATVFDRIGIALLLGGVALTVVGKGKCDGGFKRGWVPISLVFFALAGGVGIVFKCFGRVSDADVSHMMLVSALVSLLLIFLFSIPSRAMRRENNGIFGKRVYVLAALLFGLASCLYNRFNVTLSAALPGTLFFPVFNGGVVVLSTLLGALLLREKCTLLQRTGLAVGLGGIILVGVL